MPIAAAVAQAGLFPNLPKANLSRGSFFLQTRRFLRNAEFPADGLRGAGAFLYFAFWQSLFPAVSGVGAPSPPAPCAPFGPLRIFKEAEPCRRNFACVMALSREVRFPLGREWKYWRGQSLARGVGAVCVGRLAPVVPHRKVWGINRTFRENARVLAVSGMGAASGVRGVAKRRRGKSVKNSFAMASDLRVCSGVSHREV